MKTHSSIFALAVILGSFIGPMLLTSSAFAKGGETINCSDASPNSDVVEDVLEGDGELAVPGKDITVHYVGSLCDGTIFDSSIARHYPFTFTLGRGQVIKGWEEGFNGMRVGGKRRIVVPASLAYGANAVGKIPANSVLIFDVHLLKVK